MDPRNARRGYAQRESRRKAASEWQNEIFSPKEGKMALYTNTPPETPWYRHWLVWLLIVAIILTSCCCLVAVVYNYWPRQAPTLEPTLAPTLVPTQIPPTLVPTVVPTLVPTEIPVPVAVSCATPSIKAGTSAADAEYGEYLDTALGKRMTFTSRKVVVPGKAWNETLTADELKAVETTWLYIQVCVPEGLTAVIFTGGFEQGTSRYENGALLSLKPGLYEFRMRNGELAIWYSGQETFASKDLERIFDQIRVGNFDIKSPLAFFGVTADLLSKIPDDMVKDRNIQIVSAPDPVVK